MSLRVFKLFSVDGWFSNQSANPRANVYFVVASSAREAHECARLETWSVGSENPRGILEIQVRRGRYAGEHWIWCGCLLHMGMPICHGDGLRALTAAMRSHMETAHSELVHSSESGSAEQFDERNGQRDRSSLRAEQREQLSGRR